MQKEATANLTSSTEIGGLTGIKNETTRRRANMLQSYN
jgi:hypothetical protein